MVGGVFGFNLLTYLGNKLTNEDKLRARHRCW